jgi:hypothetical protein
VLRTEVSSLISVECVWGPHSQRNEQKTGRARIRDSTLFNGPYYRTDKKRKRKEDRRKTLQNESRRGSLFSAALSFASLLLGFQVIQQVVQSISGLAELLDDNARAVNDLAGVGLLVEFAQTSPLTQLLAVRDSHQLQREF